MILISKYIQSPQTLLKKKIAFFFSVFINPFKNNNPSKFYYYWIYILFHFLLHSFLKRNLLTYTKPTLGAPLDILNRTWACLNLTTLIQNYFIMIHRLPQDILQLCIILQFDWLSQKTYPHPSNMESSICSCSKSLPIRKNQTAPRIRFGDITD